MAAAAETYKVREQLRSFDPMATVDLLKFDMVTSRQIQPETMQRVMDEELSYIAEGIDRPLKTSFTLQELDGQLVYFDRGGWLPYTGMLIKGLKVAEQEALTDHRKVFLADRAAADLAIGYKMQELGAGQKISWYSPFPENELQQHGKDFITSLGFQPQRRMGFLYQATRLANGNLQLDSQTVDNSNWQSFQASMRLAERDSSATISELRSAYDKILELQSGLPHYAGKNTNLANRNDHDDAWDSMHKHKDLLTYFFDGIVAIAENEELTRSECEEAKKELTYGVWAALKSRLDSKQVTYKSDVYSDLLSPPIQYEVHQAYRSFSKRNEILPGCGGSIGGGKELLGSNKEDVFDAIFGKADNEPEHYEFDKFMHCVVCQAPPKRKDESKKMCGPCGICKGCDNKLSSKMKL